MATKENKISILISAVDEASSVINKVGGSLTNFARRNEEAFKSMRNYGAIAFGSIATSAGVAIKAFAESESQLARVDQTLRNSNLKNLGLSFEEASTKAREFGASLQATAGIGDETGAESFARLIQLTGDLKLATEGATLAADIATAKQVDMATGTQIVALALEGNVRALKAYGIEVDENASKTEIMSAIQAKFGGQAEAFGKTISGQGAILNQTFGDIQENIGSALIPALQALLNTVKPIIDSFAKWSAENPETLSRIILVGGGVAGLVAVLGTLGLAIPAIVAGIGAIGTAMVFLATNPIVLITGAIVAVGYALYKLVTDWEIYKGAFVLMWQDLSAKISLIIEGIKIKFSEWGNNTKLFLKQLWIDFTAIILGAKGAFVDAFSGIFNSVKETVTTIFSSVVSWVEEKVNYIVRQLKKAKDTLLEIATLGGANTPTFNGARAVGGYTSPNTPYLVGERGPEIFVPNGAGRVIPNNQIGGGQTISIHFGNVTISNGMDMDSFTEKIKSVIYNEHRQARLGY